MAAQPPEPRRDKIHAISWLSATIVIGGGAVAAGAISFPELFAALWGGIAATTVECLLLTYGAESNEPREPSDPDSDE